MRGISGYYRRVVLMKGIKPWISSAMSPASRSSSSRPWRWYFLCTCSRCGMPSARAPSQLAGRSSPGHALHRYQPPSGRPEVGWLPCIGCPGNPYGIGRRLCPRTRLRPHTSRPARSRRSGPGAGDHGGNIHALVTDQPHFAGRRLRGGY